MMVFGKPERVPRPHSDEPRAVVPERMSKLLCGAIPWVCTLVSRGSAPTYVPPTHVPVMAHFETPNGSPRVAQGFAPPRDSDGRCSRQIISTTGPCPCH